jgi:hypothetical protein
LQQAARPQHRATFRRRLSSRSLLSPAGQSRERKLPEVSSWTMGVCASPPNQRRASATAPSASSEVRGHPSEHASFRRLRCPGSRRYFSNPPPAVKAPAAKGNRASRVAHASVIVPSRECAPKSAGSSVHPAPNRRASHRLARWSAAIASDFQAARRAESVVEVNFPLP